jgi:hypothetical protein
MMSSQLKRITQQNPQNAVMTIRKYHSGIIQRQALRTWAEMPAFARSLAGSTPRQSLPSFTVS